ncbi:inositol monophosphatase family protein [Aureimonas sp. AU4]|uniref:inositol monophosphatase family protein n=1 Tax=Aureimonas sp. AU4 TaxID=1638163 RepID=UPI000785626D|nr:inositol monophosphatase family protein [Aureimonas sp. AU4]
MSDIADFLFQTLREAARSEVLPRFRRLAQGDVREKTSAIDLVTEADEAAERFIQAACARSHPQAVFVGEEGVVADPKLLTRIRDAELAIVVDPIDGTANFAAGAPMFGMMAAVVRGNETIAGVIYDPLGDDAMIGERGAGAFLVRPDGERERLRVAAALPLAESIAVASTSYLPTAERRDVLTRLADLRILANYRTAAQEYRLMASGHVHFQFYLKLMPWDHLAGSLLVEEAGGHVRRLDGGRYVPSDVAGGLLTAPDADSWAAMRELLGPGITA